jgi:hypothetical protein
MHIDFDLKSPCPMARIFLLLAGPGHGAGHAVNPHVDGDADPTRRSTDRCRQSRRYCTDVRPRRRTQPMQRRVATTAYGQCVVENAATSLASETLIRYPAQAGHDDG